MVANALHTLQTGVTTVRDLGASNFTDIDVVVSKVRWVMQGGEVVVERE